MPPKSECVKEIIGSVMPPKTNNETGDQKSGKLRHRLLFHDEVVQVLVLRRCLFLSRACHLPVHHAMSLLVVVYVRVFECM